MMGRVHRPGAGALLCAAVALGLAVAAVRADDETRPPPEVTVAAGSLSGKWLTSREGRAIAAFEGVPYAAPPVGQLRFHAPQQAEPWDGVRSAVQPGSPCTQRNVYFHLKEVEGSEDCLYINVYAPEVVSRVDPLPVLFWIHGGGWLSGEGSLYGPQVLLDRDVILVTFNYRLGPLGFLSTGDDVIPGNNGLKDMVQALRWVRDNIRAFGGDPGNVMIFGQSAGGASAHLLTLSPLSKGLFHRSMALSGNGFTPWAFHPPGQARRQARVLAEHTKCPATPSDAFLACLRTKTAVEVTSVDERFFKWDIQPHMPFKATAEPAGEGAFLEMHPRDAYGAGLLHDDVPFATGITSQDGAISVTMFMENDTNLQDINERFNFVASNILNIDTYPEYMRTETLKQLRKFYFGDGPIDRDATFNLIDMATDAMFLYPATEVIKMHKKYSKAPVFFYEFAHLSQSHRSFVMVYGGPSPDYGVCHTDDLLYLFPLGALFPGEMAPDDVVTLKRHVDFVVNFARTGKPTTDRSWQEVAHPDEAEYLHIGSPGDVQMRANIAQQRMRLWSEVPIRLGRMPILHEEL